MIVELIDYHTDAYSSDAVWQYLLVQYATFPDDFRPAEDTVVRIGDVLILPKWGFVQPVPQESEWDVAGPHPEKRAVTHSMLGRWRDKH